MRLQPAVTVAACLCSLAGTAIAQTPSFTLLGARPGQTGSSATAVSADGRTVVGYTAGKGFVWHPDTGRYDFGLEPDFIGLNSDAYAVTADGATVVGSVGDTVYRWQGPGTYQSLG